MQYRNYHHGKEAPYKVNEGIHMTKKYPQRSIWWTIKEQNQLSHYIPHTNHDRVRPLTLGQSQQSVQLWKSTIGNIFISQEMVQIQRNPKIDEKGRWREKWRRKTDLHTIITRIKSTIGKNRNSHEYWNIWIQEKWSELVKSVIVLLKRAHNLC